MRELSFFWVACLLLPVILLLSANAGANDAGAGGAVAPDAAAARNVASGTSASAMALDAGQDVQALSDATAALDARPRPNWVPKLTATVKPAAVVLGDPVSVTIKARYAKGVSLTLPVKIALAEFTELSRKESHKDVGAKDQIPEVEQVFELKVAAYELGELTLPAIELTALGPRGELVVLKTQPVPIKVKGLLANEPDPKLKELDPPVSVFQRDWLLLYILLVLAAIGFTVTATLMINRRLRARREAAKPPAPPTPAHIIALGQLAELDVDTYLSQEDYKGLYHRLSEIIRGYVGGRWHFDALEMITPEIDRSLIRRSVAPNIRGRLEDYLNTSDLVKFAKAKPQPNDAVAAVSEAREFIHDTMVAIVVQPSVTGAGTAVAPIVNATGGETTELKSAEEVVK